MMSDAQEFNDNYQDDPCDDITTTKEWHLWLRFTESSTEQAADKS